jgi:hypothetical protein
MIRKPRVRKTPNGWHPYTATLRGEATYGWGNNPAEAKAKLTENLARIAAEKAAPREAFATEPTEQGNQFVIPGCEKDRTRGPKQGDLF